MVKFLKWPGMLLLIAALMITGCSSKTDSEPVNTSTESKEIKPLNKEGAITLISQAIEMSNTLFAEKPMLTTEEIYKHYDPLFNRNYVDQIVLKGGNLKENDGTWAYAHEGGELLEGTFINSLTEDSVSSENAKDGKTVTVTNVVGDGLYAPHHEIITLVYTNAGWKIDNLVWEKAK
ncbi:hypothetical protein PAECIP111892_05053 [Paenibacillus auburnensis]|uniref:Nuclear transport factor 2 family protein n=1 Tax=Paenibacillus auburnensis TaxID=2905649 RepID=A0ABM9CT35_9BACL|nr:IseA DL-endopeptidase inhibitor family protein [Paenibacillus auburnensis]CAH1221821.1 hypothetical protein PAECIP111892_05053 [Paenibacillus auburnensis]